MNHYRDPVAGLLGQIATKRAQIADRAGRTTPVLRALLPAASRAELRALEAQVDGHGDPAPELGMEALVAIDVRCGELLARYDDLAARSADLRTCDDDDLTDPAPSRTPRSAWLMEGTYVREVRLALRHRLKDIAPDLDPVRYGDFAYLARFTREDARLSFVVLSGAGLGPSSPPDFTCYLRTVIPPAIDDLDVKPETLLQTLARAAHLARELSFGHDAFDDAFWVTGSADAASILSHTARNALVELAPLAPHLTLGGGLATLSWRGPHGMLMRRPLPEDALDVMTALRRAIATG